MAFSFEHQPSREREYGRGRASYIRTLLRHIALLRSLPQLVTEYGHEETSLYRWRHRSSYRDRSRSAALCGGCKPLPAPDRIEAAGGARTAGADRRDAPLAAGWRR